MKQAEQGHGAPLAGLTVKVVSGFFLFGTSAAESDMQRTWITERARLVRHPNRLQQWSARRSCRRKGCALRTSVQRSIRRLGLTSLILWARRRGPNIMLPTLGLSSRRGGL